MPHRAILNRFFHLRELHWIWIDGDDENVFSIHKESDDDKEYHILKMIGEDDDHHISWVEDFEGDEKSDADDITD